MIAAVGVMWINAEPTQRLRSLYKKNDWFNRLINCCLCSTFWIYIVVSASLSQFNIGEACISAIIAEFICRKINEGSL
jgi:hypothetical protein